MRAVQEELHSHPGAAATGPVGQALLVWGASVQEPCTHGGPYLTQRTHRALWGFGHTCVRAAHFRITLERQGNGQVWLRPERSVARLVWKVQLLLGGGGQLHLWAGGPWAGLPQPSEVKDLGHLAFCPAPPCGWRRAIYPSRAKV